MGELSLIQTDDLITESMNRHEHAIFAGMLTGIVGKKQYLVCIKWVGNSATCVGLCSQLECAINKTEREESTVVDIDGDR